MGRSRDAILSRLESAIARIRGAATTDPAPPEEEPEPVVEDSEAKPPSMTLTSRLFGVGWRRDSQGHALLWLKGSAWRSHGEQHGSRVTGVSLHSGDRVVHGTVVGYVDPAVNNGSRSSTEDRSDAAFLATFDPSDLLTEEQQRAGDESVFQTTWKTLITVEDEYGTVTKRFQTRDEAASPGDLPQSYDIGSGCLARPEWDGKVGLRVIVARRAYVAESVGFDTAEDRLRFQAVIRARSGSVPDRAFFKQDKKTRPLTLEPLDADRYRVSGPVDDLPDLVAPNRAGLWYLHLGQAEGGSRHAHWQGTAEPGHLESSDADPRIGVRNGPNGVIRIDVVHRRLVVTGVTVTDPDGEVVDQQRRLDDPDVTATPTADQPDLPVGQSDIPSRQHRMLIISGDQLAMPDDPTRWQLTGGRRPVPAAAVEVADGRFRASFALQGVLPWGKAVRPLPSASHQLTVLTDPPAAAEDGAEEGTDRRAASVTGSVHPTLAGSLIRTVRTPGHRITIGRNKDNSLRIELGPPRQPAELSAFHRRQLETAHQEQPCQPRNAVLYECFDGKSAGDNTRPVHDELLRRRPDLERIWVVADLSVEVPEGSRRVLRYSAEWWQALSSSRLFVTNCWTPRMFHSRDHQRVLQTWHGTPLKLLGFDRIGTKRGEEYVRRTRNEVAQWDLFLSQNPHSSSVFRSAYGYEGRILESGYPRNDVLVRADDNHRQQIRQRLGIGADELVILYVPTWREGAKGLFQELDFEAVADALGDQGRLLIRGHANTLAHGSNLTGRGLIDVTQYPELSDLYLIADAMITDFSSAMFDFSITGRPMIFFAPDLEEYASHRRGTYFDLTEKAPGPILSRTDEVIDAIGSLDRLRGEYAEPYRDWQATFNPYDDGRAAERVVDALLDGIDLDSGQARKGGPG